MFNKTKCVCGKRISKKLNYCSYCGTAVSELAQLKKEEKLRKDATDAILKDVEKSFGIPSIMHFPFKQLVNKLSKDIEKQFREFDQELVREPNIKVPKGAKKEEKKIIQDGKQVGDMQSFSFPGGFSVQIKLGGPTQNFSSDIAREEIMEKEKKLPTSATKKFSKEEQDKLSKLPREEPATKVRRLSNKVVYEIELPGVKDKKDIILNRLQNSIEIKAISKDKAYFKLIPVSMPVKDWKLEKEKLILELQP